MSERLQAIRGMNDVLPNASYGWRNLEQIFARCLGQYGYQEIRLPLVESTQLFKRTIGEVTDIVEKEMYTFTDLNGESITLRPEGTSGCVRACIEHSLLHNQQQKLWYCGPMFRHEKPQKGRYRQFNQLGVEVFGIAGTAIELELISICHRLWEQLGIEKYVRLEVNTLAELHERQVYRQILIDYLTPFINEMDEDSRRRLHKNPLRILDSKNPEMSSIIANAPKLIDVISEESRTLFQSFCTGLESMGIAYTVNPFLVRGLDYYGHSVFEWVTDELGSQATVCAGGRFDKLVEQLGGSATPSVGFAMGMERLLLLRETVGLVNESEPTTDCIFIAVGEDALQCALVLSETLRNANPNWRILVNTAGGSFKSQFKKADKSGARFGLILGDNELKHENIGIKDLRVAEDQKTIPQHQLSQFLETYLK